MNTTPWISALVVSQDHQRYGVRLPDGTCHHARVAGAFAYQVVDQSDFPAVGDTVLCTGDGNDGADVLIHQVHPRGGIIARLRPGGATVQQVIAANVNVALLVFGLDGGRSFTEGLLARMLATVHAGSVRAVVVLNKCDCATTEDIEDTVRRAAETAPAAPIHVVSARTGEGMDGLRSVWEPGETACLLGASGVGKSSMLNALLGRTVERTGDLRADGRGRHTTTRRRLLEMECGRRIVDVPGLRELQLWSDASAVDEAFRDIDEFARQCRFRDCRHAGEPGCAVQEALFEGFIEPDRFDRFLELRRETEWLHVRQDVRAREAHDAKWKAISKAQKRMKKSR